jgi:hypothetical protein
MWPGRQKSNSRVQASCKHQRALSTCSIAKSVGSIDQQTKVIQDVRGKTVHDVASKERSVLLATNTSFWHQ